jgi:hypothetical protein
MRIYILSFIVYMMLWSSFKSKKLVRFIGRQKIARSLSSLSLPPERSSAFHSWFADPSTPSRILKSNPGIKEVQQIEERQYVARLTPITFPGLKVLSSVNFDCFFDGRTFEVVCKENSLQQEYEGPKALASLVSKLQPKVVSRNLCAFDLETNTLSNEAMLDISFMLPSWFPIPHKVLEERGSAVVQAGMEKDLSALVDSLLAQFQDTERRASI